MAFWDPTWMTFYDPSSTSVSLSILTISWFLVDHGKNMSNSFNSLRHSPTTSSIFEPGQMLICDDYHQLFGVCNWLCRHSCRPKKGTYPQILAHSSKHSWTKKFSWFGEFLSTIHTWIRPHRMAFELVDERKWENYLQMDTDTTSFWTNKKQALYFTSTCVT